MCKIRRDTEFDGYAGKKELTSSKILHNVFADGDAYFNSGDLLTVDKDYFVYFSDRIGDTFRYCTRNARALTYFLSKVHLYFSVGKERTFRQLRCPMSCVTWAGSMMPACTACPSLVGSSNNFYFFFFSSIKI